MLLASSFGDAFAHGLGFAVIFFAVAIYCVRKFAEANPEVSNAAKKAAAAKALQLIGRVFK